MTVDEINRAFSNLADWIEGSGWIEIGNREWQGFVVRALSEAGEVCSAPRNRTTETAIFCQSYHCDRCMLIHCCSNSLGVKYPSAE